MRRALFGLFAGLLLFGAAAALFTAGFQWNHRGKIFAGVSVAGIDVSGLTPVQAAERINQSLIFGLDGKIAFQDRATVWVAKPVELGFFLDAAGSANEAFSIGRDREPIYSFLAQLQYGRSDLPPRYIYDEQAALAFLQDLSLSIDVPTVEASLSLNGLDVIVNPGQIGRQLDVGAALAALGPQLASLQDGLIELQVSETPPAILDAGPQAELARRILNAPLLLRDPDSPPDAPLQWIIEAETLAKMLIIERVDSADGQSAFRVVVDPTRLEDFLSGLSAGLAIDPQNARFIFNDDTRKLEVIQNSVIGRDLMVQASAQAINEQLALGNHSVALIFDYVLPEVTQDATAEQLGITELVSSQTSYFTGSSTGRMDNIALAAGRFHGVLVAPGETFSMAEVLGDVSLDTGFAEALIIFGNRTIKGVGGGVCQVSTTLFRTAFFGGFQIDERYPHAYRVYYYELAPGGGIDTRLAGLDATVYVPLVDFKFTNDTDHWLLMETYTSKTYRTLTWKFYSTSDGRSVEWTTSGLQNKVEPPDPLYEENEDLDKGEIRQVDWAVEGADVTVNRIVTRDGVVIHDDTFRTHYRPWQAVYQYGPGTKLPKEAEPEPW